MSTRTASVLATTSRCPECGSRAIPDGVEVVCSACGLVVDEDPIDRGPETRTFQDDEEDRERTGAPRTLTRHDRGLSTRIGNRSERKQLPAEKRKRLYRQLRYHKRATLGSRRNRREAYALAEIRRLTNDVGLPPSLHEHACGLFQTAHGADLAVGRDLDALTAAVVYASSRQTGLTRPIEEVAAAARADDQKVKRTYLSMIQELDLDIGPPDPREYLPKIASAVDAHPRAENTARRILEEAPDEAVVGMKPNGVAAAALYIAHRGSLSQADVGSASGTCPVTVRHARDRLLEGGAGEVLGDAE